MMIKHVTMFKLRTRSEELLESAHASIASLGEGIDEVRSLEIGIDFAQTSLSYDIVATVYFDDRADLEAYSKHPRHRAVAATMRELSEAVAIVDFEAH